MLWMNHTCQFFRFRAMVIQNQVTGKYAIFIKKEIIKKEIIGFFTLLRTQPYPAYAHVQVFMVIAYTGKPFNFRYF